MVYVIYRRTIFMKLFTNRQTLHNFPGILAEMYNGGFVL